MNPSYDLYEKYVAKYIKQVFGDEWDVSVQEETHSLFQVNKFMLKPDIVLRKDERCIILDTKWKELINDEEKNYGIKSEDMYQMYAYAGKYNTKEVWLLYPEHPGTDNIKNIQFKNDITVTPYFIKLYPLENTSVRLKTVLRR